jgi:hypothetical protein
MPYTVHRWSNEDVVKLKSMPQKYPTAAIAAQLGRSTAATIVKAHELKLSLRVRRSLRGIMIGTRVAVLRSTRPEIILRYNFFRKLPEGNRSASRPRMRS